MVETRLKRRLGWPVRLALANAAVLLVAVGGRCLWLWPLPEPLESVVEAVVPWPGSG